MAGFASRQLRTGALVGIVVAAIASGAVAQQRVGIDSAVNQQATGTPPGGTTRPLVIGQDVVFNERIATTAQGQTQLLFVDESSMSIGPNSDLTIDRFVFDPKTGTGQQAMSATRGLLRYVGGKLSKQDGAVTLRTSTATLAVRGGAFILNMQRCPRVTPTCNNSTEAIFLYGDGITLTDALGTNRTVSRPGFEISISPTGVSSPPRPAPPQELAQLTAELDGRTGGTGGASVVPTNASVAQVSGPLTATLDTSLLNSTAFPTQIVTASEQQSLNPQPNTAPQVIDCSISSSIGCGSTVVVGTTPSGQPVGGPPSPPATVAANFAGRLKNTNGAGTARGFADQSANGDIAYTNGTLTLTNGAPQSGVFSGTFGSVGTLSFPLVPGTNSFQGTSSTLGAVSGTSFLSSDDTFFYASLTPVNSPSQRLFVFGGTPVNSSFYQPNGPGARPNFIPGTGVNSNTRIFAFTVQPDAALLSSIPFIRSQAGGNLPNAMVSPFYVVAPSSTAIGDTSSAAAARGMQASLAINGQGANQQSAIGVTAGTIGAQANGQPFFNGAMRGSSLLSANGTPVALGSGVASTVDGNGVSFYGGNSITGFVLNQSPGLATETNLSGAQTTYGFAQPALAGSLPSGVGTNRTTQALSGNFGGLMYTNAQGTPYIATGGAVISTDASNNRIQATLSGTPQTPAAGASALTMQYGSLTGTPGGQAFIDNNNFAATESAVNPQQITVNGSTSQPNGQLYLVSSSAAGVPTQLLPPGASFCQCQYLQWGYWGGSLTTPTAGGTPRIDAGNINTWVAGVPTPLSDINSLETMSAKASYTGAAIGSVYNNGASYVAAGGFNAAYNFGTQTGSFAITNFDGHTFGASGSAPLTGSNYTFSAAGAGLAGKINGAFYGPMAAETGGNFAFQSTVGPAYLASGTYAGKQ